MNNKISYSEDLENKAIGEIMSSKFKSLAKEFFQLDISEGINYEKMLKDSSQLYSFNLPLEINETFIHLDDAPIFWLKRSPVVIVLENFYKLSIVNLSGRNYYKTVRDFYTKWWIIKSDEEKRYFSSSAINYLEKKTNNSNVLLLVFHAMILAYDEYIYDPLKSFELLERAKENVNQSSITAEYKNEIIYILDICEGFVFTKQNEYKLAQNYFESALKIKPMGVTAKFYLAFINSLIDNQPIAEDLLEFVYQFDLTRIEYAIEQNSTEMLDLLLKYPTFNNFFLSPDLSSSYEVISNFLRNIKSMVYYDLQKIKASINNFKNLNIEDYYNENTSLNINYLEKILNNYSKKENVLFIGVSEKLHSRFVQTIEAIINKIKDKYSTETLSKLQIYDSEIQNKLNEIQSYTKEKEEIKNKIKERTAKTISSIEKRTAENIAAIEEKISYLQFVPNFDPKAAFQNAMTYNLILSFTVFLLGGCAGYTNSSFEGIGSLNSAMAIILVSGLKWGIIAFGIGIVISLVTAGLAAFEGSNQKQKLFMNINSLKKEKDFQIEYFKKEAENSERLSEEKINKTIEDKKRYIDKLRNERATQEKKYNDESLIKMENECKPLQNLIDL